MKLQQAYFSESSMAGGWQLIGYMAPSGAGASETTNFAYGVGDIATGTSNNLQSEKTGWTARNKQALNECTAPAASAWSWQVKVSKATNTGNNGADIAFAASANGGAGCVALTPTFDKIGK